jgi:hypothetical protein
MKQDFGVIFKNGGPKVYSSKIQCHFLNLYIKKKYHREAKSTIQRIEDD